MKIHSLFRDPTAVVVSKTELANPVCGEDYRLASHRVLSAIAFELDGEKLVIKPNVTIGESYADPNSGITTHPGFVHGMIDYFLQHGVRSRGVYLLEDPRNSDDNVPRDWKGTGYGEVAEATGAKLRCPSDYNCVKVEVPQAFAHTRINVSRLAVGPDTVFINVPKLKTHNLAITTLCMKNLMGVVNTVDRHYCRQAWLELPEEMRDTKARGNERMDATLHGLWQKGLARRLVDTAQVATPHFNLIEGVVGRDGTGFRQGRNFRVGLAIGGTNMVAVDSVASYLMGFDPGKLIYLSLAAEAGLGINDLERLRVYTVKNGALDRCTDVDALKIDPPFQVINKVEDDAITSR
ncbi:MAG: hypothetical protein CMN78_02350 [Spirochaetales bacterium]|nr:hypothetical protein [Spirochaetales bacterium]